jgi:hypothetical protein
LNTDKIKNAKLFLWFIEKSAGSRLSPFPIRRADFFQRLPYRQPVHRYVLVFLPLRIPDPQFIGGRLVMLAIFNLLSDQ